MSSPKDQIKERLSIEDCISSYITILPSGKNFKAKCPFHNEKTPSFFISPERGNYYCFGCGEKGDIFSFVEKFEGVDFPGALKILAIRTGVALDSFHTDNTDNKEVLYQIMEKATEYFEGEFQKENTARAYLLDRGLNDNTIKEFRIGYSPQSWRSVSDFLLKSGFKKEDILKVGLIKKSEKDNGKSFYDRFRGRIMFPISDSSSRVIAFSGRILKESSEAKYINSTDTLLYNKSNTLFGIDKAKLNIRSKGYVIIVEGQLDLLLSHQIGLNNTVAVSGTALSSSIIGNESEDTINNLGLIRRLSSNVIFAFDGDEAGMRATRRASMIAFSLDMQVKIANLNDGRDPADIIKNNKEEWKNIIKGAKHIISFEIDKMCVESNDQKVWGRKIREIIFPYLNNIKSKIEQSIYLKEIHDKTGITESAIHIDFENYQRQNLVVVEEQKKGKIKTISRITLLEKQFFSIIFLLENDDKTKSKAEKYIKEVIDKIGEKVFKDILNRYELYKDIMVIEAEIWYGREINSIEKDLEEIILNLEEEILIIKARDKMMEIRKYDNNKEKSQKLLFDYQNLINKIQNIKNSRL